MVNSRTSTSTERIRMNTLLYEYCLSFQVSSIQHLVSTLPLIMLYLLQSISCGIALAEALLKLERNAVRFCSTDKLSFLRNRERATFVLSTEMSRMDAICFVSRFRRSNAHNF